MKTWSNCLRQEQHQQYFQVFSFVINYSDLNLPNTVENKARGELSLLLLQRLDCEGLAGSQRFPEILSGLLVELTHPETQTQPASLALLLPGEDEALRLPSETA